MFVGNSFEIDKIVFPPALQTDRHPVKNNFWAQGTPKYDISTKTQIKFVSLLNMLSLYYSRLISEKVKGKDR